MTLSALGKMAFRPPHLLIQAITGFQALAAIGLSFCMACGGVTPDRDLGSKPLRSVTHMTTGGSPAMMMVAGAGAGAGAGQTEEEAGQGGSMDSTVEPDPPNPPDMVTPPPPPPEVAPTCDLGSATSAATADMLDLFEQISYFAHGRVLPAGMYRVTYLDGCVKYNGLLDWTVNNPPVQGFWVVSADSDDRIVEPPGVDGVLVGIGTGAYKTFSECVAASLLVPPVDFMFKGGKLGIWMNDGVYGDNVVGEDGRNPSWKLTKLDGCSADLLNSL